MKTLKVMHVVGGLDISGRSRLIHDICRGVSRDDCESVICSLSGDCGYQESDIECVRLPKRRGLDVQAARRLAREARQRGIDVIHSHGRGAFIYAFLARTTLGRSVRLIHTVHRSDGDPVSSRRWLRTWLIRRADRVTAVSSAAAAAFANAHRMAAADVEVIHNGIEPSRFCSPSPLGGEGRGEGPIIGTVANLSFDKDIATLLRALARLNVDGGNARLLLVGDGPARPAAEALAAGLGISERVEFMGHREDVPEILAGLDIFVLSTTTEGFGLALLEAMATGVPVVASNVGGIPEIISDGVNGLLFPVGDDRQLADAIDRLLKDEPTRQKFIAAGRDTVQTRFTTKRMCREYEQLYRQIIDNRQ